MSNFKTCIKHCKGINYLECQAYWVQDPGDICSQQPGSGASHVVKMQASATHVVRVKFLTCLAC